MRMIGSRSPPPMPRRGRWPATWRGRSQRHWRHWSKRPRTPQPTGRPSFESRWGRSLRPLTATSSGSSRSGSRLLNEECQMRTGAARRPLPLVISDGTFLDVDAGDLHAHIALAVADLAAVALAALDLVDADLGALFGAEDVGGHGGARE